MERRSEKLPERAPQQQDHQNRLRLLSAQYNQDSVMFV